MHEIRGLCQGFLDYLQNPLDLDNKKYNKSYMVQNLIDRGQETAQRTGQQEERQLHELGALFDGHFPGHTMQRLRTPDGRYRYSYVSPGVKQTFGLDPDALMNASSVRHDWLHDDDRRRFLEALERSAETLGTLDEEVRVLLPDGRCKWVRSIGHPRRLDDGTVIWDGVALDVTDRHEALDALHRALSAARSGETSHGRMATIAARDIAAPLRRLGQAVDRLRGDAQQAELVKAFDDLERSLGATVHLLGARAAETAPPEEAPDDGARAGLTRRQRDVLAQIREGCSNREIAARLGISEGTVKLHVSAVLKALGVKNRTRAAKL